MLQEILSVIVISTYLSAMGEKGDWVHLLIVVKHACSRPVVGQDYFSWNVFTFFFLFESHSPKISARLWKVISTAEVKKGIRDGLLLCLLGNEIGFCWADLNQTLVNLEGLHLKELQVSQPC